MTGHTACMSASADPTEWQATTTHLLSRPADQRHPQFPPITALSLRPSPSSHRPRAAGFLFFKGVQGANEAAERQDKLDGYIE